MFPEHLLTTFQIRTAKKRRETKAPFLKNCKNEESDTVATDKCIGPCYSAYPLGKF